MVRIVVGLIVGLVVALAALMGVGWVNQLVYPALGAVSIDNQARLGEIMLALPVGAQVIIAAAWFAGALVGGWAAGAISRLGWTIWLITGIVAAIAVMSVMAVTYPRLLQICSVVAPLLGGVAARALLRRTPAAGMGAPA
jgi:hypothetical protein